MKWLVVVAALAGCTNEDSDDAVLDPATCPDAPFEHCIVHDNGWEVWCENGVVLANDMTANSYCFPDSTEVACITGGRAISTLETCATSCASTERRYFDYHGDYIAFDASTLCAPP